jgi:hypothetical protein
MQSGPSARTVVIAALSHLSTRIAHSADPDQPFRPIAITDSGDPDHAVHYA